VCKEANSLEVSSCPCTPILPFYKRREIERCPFACGYEPRRGASCSRAPYPRVTWLHAPQATTRAWRPPRPCGRPPGLRGMLSPAESDATLQGRTAGTGPRAAEERSPAWPGRMTHAHDDMGGRCTGHNAHNALLRCSGAGRPRFDPSTSRIIGSTPCWRKRIRMHPGNGTPRRATVCTRAVRASWAPCSWHA
jgi:hypothetical protein